MTFIKIGHLLRWLIFYSSWLIFLTASLVSGLTKAWLGTQTNGTKEVSFSDHTHSGYALTNHTHTANQISGLTTANVAFSSSYISSSSESITTTSSFTPVFAILFYSSGDDGNYVGEIHFAHKDGKTSPHGIQIGRVAYDNCVTAVHKTFSFSTNSVTCSNMFYSGYFMLITFA